MANAIIMASGLGTRMLPLTRTTPKPLLKVKGVPMAETVICALKNAGVENIYVVVGYLKEQFDYLKEKFGVKIIENPDFRTVNNISSVYYASDVLEQGETFICEADLYIRNSELLKAERGKSCYFGKFKEGYSSDWVFERDENGRITRVGKGGNDLYNMVGLSYFTAEDAFKLSGMIKKAYKSGNYEKLFWDEVVDANLNKLDMCVIPVREDDIYELDTPEELSEANKIK